MEWFGDQVAALNGDDFHAAVLALVRLVTVAVAFWTLVIVPTRRLMRGVLFVGVTGALAFPAAHAEDRGVDGLRLPDRPMVAGAVEPDVRVVVRSGDTLWAIACAHLRSGADDASTARAVDRWYAANAGVIGDDPDLIHPGQRLTPPKDRP